ncbi:MAG: hypothetical protein LBU89_12550 [Fibromonadaceae bacterium]|jgi:hypothetical protein|nr:hypothetical protein [Fibromonadaceae bacterium]
MKEKNDLFIIGAGASVPYGFPSSEILLEKIKSKASSWKDIKKDVAYLYKSELNELERPGIIGAATKLSTDLNMSMMVSIDDFMRNRASSEKPILKIQADLIKRVIAEIILNSEKNIKPVVDWLHYLCSQIDRGDAIFTNSEFITFNYDRLLEYSIFNYLTCDKKHQSKDAIKEINKMNIIHANGSLGSLEQIKFGEEQISNTVVEGMRTIWDKNTIGSYEIDECITSRISRSKRIFFLGFGYLPENLEKLFIVSKEKTLVDKEIYGTARGKTDAEIKRLYDLFYSCGAKNVEISKRDAKNLIIDFFNV